MMRRGIPALLTVLVLVGAGCLGGEGRPPGAVPSPTGPLRTRDFGGRTAAVHGTLQVDTSNATVAMYDRYFEPNVLTGPPGLRVTLMVRNEGTQLHNLTLASQSISQDVAPGSIVAVPVVLPDSGEAVFFCRFHRDLGMVGALVAS
jgi:plastocyanin